MRFYWSPVDSYQVQARDVGASEAGPVVFVGEVNQEDEWIRGFAGDVAMCANGLEHWLEEKRIPVNQEASATHHTRVVPHE